MSDEILLKSRKFRVVHRMINGGSGGPVGKDMILHPGAAVVLPITATGEVVMVRNYRWTINRELLELPAGTLEPLEEPQECAFRELEEETGYAAGTLRPLCRFYSSPGVMNELIHAFVATDLKPGPQHLSCDEQIRVDVMSFEQIDDAIRVGKIMDGKTLATILYYKTLEKP